MKDFKKYFFLLVGTLLLTTTSYLFTDRPIINDGKEYCAAANNLLKYNKLYAGELDKEIDYRLYSKRTLGYPFFLIFQYLNPTIALLSCVGLVLLNFFLGIFILSRFRAKKRAYHVFGLFYILHLPFVFHATFPLSDLLLCTVMTTMVAVFYDSKNSTKSKLLAVGFLWGLGLLIKPILLPTVILSPLVFLYFKFKRGQNSIAILLPLMVFIVGSGINYLNTNQYEYSSISTINLGQYNAKLTISKAYGYDSAQAYVSRSEFTSPSTPEEYAKYKTDVTSLATSTILENLNSYLTVHLAGSLKMLMDPGRFELYTFFNEPTADGSLTEMIYAQRWTDLENSLAKRPILFILFILLFALAVIKLIAATFSIGQLKKLGFILFITAYFVAISGPVGAARFMLPVSVIYIIIVTIGAEAILHFFQKRSKGK